MITERARGSRLWDVDGNEYIDIVNGYGCIMFGHSPEFVVEAATAQLAKGVAIGPQSPLAAEVAALICELTGNERVTFCNTGSEAVMAAMRVARTVTGRDKIVYFAGDYHGTFDEVLIRNTPRGSAPVAPGIPDGKHVTNIVVLEYGAPTHRSNGFATNAEDLAAVHRRARADAQSRPATDRISSASSACHHRADSGTAIHHRRSRHRISHRRLAASQQAFGIRADMCTYGKVIGGGHPIGVLSGKHQYILTHWTVAPGSSATTSAPEVGVTFFAGTFVRHPLATGRR